MTLGSMLLKGGAAMAGAGIYLLFKRFVRKVKKTTNKTAEKIETKLVKAKKKVTGKPRPKKVPARAVHA